MGNRTTTYVLVGLLVILAGVLFYSWHGTPAATAALPTSTQFRPLGVEDPQIRLDLLKTKPPEYSGTHRNIFTAVPAPSPVPVHAGPKHIKEFVRQGPPPPTPVPSPPPIVLPVTYFGYASSQIGNERKAFFADSNGDNVYVVAEGETLLGRFRIVKINPDSVEVEEISSGRRTTLQLPDMSPSS